MCCQFFCRYEETLKGVLLSVPIDIIEGAGWRKVMVEAYSHKTSLAELEDCTSYREAGREEKVPYKYIIVGARENTAPRLSLCALGRTQTVLKRTEGVDLLAARYFLIWSQHERVAFSSFQSFCAAANGTCVLRLHTTHLSACTHTSQVSHPEVQISTLGVECCYNLYTPRCFFVHSLGS